MIVCRDSSLGTWRSSFPHRFLALLVADRAQQELVLADFKAEFIILEHLEQASYQDHTIKQLLLEMVWPADTFVREIFIDLIEGGWSLPLTANLLGRLEAFSRSSKRTKIQEDLFQRCRKREQLSDSGQCSRRGRYDVATRCGLIAAYDRREIIVSAEAKLCAPRHMGASYFESKAGSKFSMGLNQLDTLHAARPDWSSPSPAGYKLRVDCWRCCVALQGDVLRIRMAWLSALCQPGYMIRHRTHLPAGYLWF